MWWLANAIPPEVNAILAVGSAAVTAYFWLIKANRERAGVKVYQIGKFRADRRTVPASEAPTKYRLWWSGDLFFANRSTLPSAIIGAEVSVFFRGQWIDGDFGWGEGAELPWNLPPLSVEKKPVAAFLKVQDEVEWDEVQKPHKLRFRFSTVDGRQFTKEVETNYEKYTVPK